MSLRIILSCFCFLCLLLLSWQSSLYPQEKEAGKDHSNLIEGDWTMVISDHGHGDIWRRLPDLSKPRMRSTFGVSRLLTRWRITKEAIEEGIDHMDGVERRFPRKRYTYKLHPGNQANAIDFSLVEKNLFIADKAKRGRLSVWEKETQRGIYFVNGDYLMLCTGQKSRPKTFANDEKYNPTTIDILRRGRGYKEDGKIVIGPKRNDK